MSYSTLLSYYEKNDIDPVPINLNGDAQWRSHVAKRRNLYENHLGIPLEFLRNRKVLEFGCNTGENALVLADFGARVTLVEPHKSQHPRLERLFDRFGLRSQIDHFSGSKIETYESKEAFDLVLCENFINCLPDRVGMLSKICGLIAPNCFGVISFDDRFGSLLEVFKRLIFHVACEKEGISDRQSSSLAMAEFLFKDDFNRINVSRPFTAWWEDVLLNPFVSWRHLWYFTEILRVIEEQKCEYYSGSPRWVTVDHLNWYKNITETKQRHQNIVDQWYQNFMFILTGIKIPSDEVEPASAAIVQCTDRLMMDFEIYMTTADTETFAIQYPDVLNLYLSRGPDAVCRINEELKEIINGLGNMDFNDIADVYHQTERLRHSWGTPCQYISFMKKE